MNEIESFHLMEFLAYTKDLEPAGMPVIHMKIGEPDFSTPRTIFDAGIAAIVRATCTRLQNAW